MGQPTERKKKDRNGAAAMAPGPYFLTLTGVEVVREVCDDGGFAAWRGEAGVGHAQHLATCVTGG